MIGHRPRGTTGSLLATALFGLLLGACGSPYPPPPDTREEAVVDVLHGVEFTDDYRWLEDQEAPETRAWIDAQNAYAELIVGESQLRDRSALD
jgi:prolyl oligopeptidase